ncbi:hypothetical protein [Streptomyces sp. V4I2]|uniref:hypothetical protein n=1 Tax=Streptomyces sp. V4I2 TaxID=3042280 RepID=UPI002782F16A|nr:hypothetical protein [Streptomyces sp. V4I2]MDQ1051762.1 hypothetical protein [Streptomyces sp. V4I2]
MTLRWLMTLGERTDPDTPTYAECPPPGQARAAALVDDFGQLFPILRNWRRQFGHAVTGWAAQVEVDDIEHPPRHVCEDWGPELRLDTVPGGYVVVSDYRDHEPPAPNTLQHQVKRPALDAGTAAHP